MYGEICYIGLVLVNRNVWDMPVPAVIFAMNEVIANVQKLLHMYNSFNIFHSSTLCMLKIPNVFCK